MKIWMQFNVMPRTFNRARINTRGRLWCYYNRHKAFGRFGTTNLNRPSFCAEILLRVILRTRSTAIALGRSRRGGVGVITKERTQVHSTRSSLVVTHLSNNRGRRAVTSVQQRIIFKIAVLAFHCVRGTCHVYFRDVCLPLAAIPGRTNLRAADWGDLLVPSTKTKIGGGSSRVAAPTVWNSLPLNLHNATISEGQFKSALKTHLFNLAYK